MDEHADDTSSSGEGECDTCGDPARVACEECARWFCGECMEKQRFNRILCVCSDCLDDSTTEEDS